MPPMRAIEVGPDTASVSKTISRILEDLSPKELERLALEVILENRHRLDKAQALFDDLEGLPTQDAVALAQLRHDYHVALVMLHNHHQLVSTVIAALGYLPTLGEEDAAPH